MKIIITESQYRILSEAYSEEEFRKKYVESGLVPENQFKEIISEFNKPFYIGWILKILSSGFIKYEDVYKFKNYFNVFEKFKQHYPIKDLGQIKTFDDVEEFERKSKDILIKQQDTEQGDVSDKKKLISTNNIQKLESVGVKYLGIVDGLQVFQVPPEVKDSQETWNLYREILGRCSGRDKGQIVSLCTMAGFNNFQNYLNMYPGSSYYVFYNMGDPLSPYQIHFESNQYMDKNDDLIDFSLTNKFTNFLLKKGLSEKLVPPFLKFDSIKEVTENINNLLDEKYKSENITFEVKKIDGDNWFEYYLPNDDDFFLVYIEKRKQGHWGRTGRSLIIKIIKDFGLPKIILKKILIDWVSNFIKLPVKSVGW